ncbi:MAG: hypothetical protein E7330_05700 [Clostridiales bacterium]|nr:hypothetical protein [Clostridiales bacterium]
MAQLILLEGIPGAGKTSVAEALLMFMRRNGFEAEVYFEGDMPHPSELEFHACFSEQEYEALLKENPQYADTLSARSFTEAGYYLIPYREKNEFLFPMDITCKLYAREFRNVPEPRIPFAAYDAITISHWKSMAEKWRDKKGFLILENAFLDHPVQDMLLNYRCSEKDILNHMRTAANALMPLSPMMFYLEQSELLSTLMRISAARGMRGMAFPEALAFWEDRHRIDSMVTQNLILPAMRIQNSIDTPEETALQLCALIGIHG